MHNMEDAFFSKILHVLIIFMTLSVTMQVTLLLMLHSSKISNKALATFWAVWFLIKDLIDNSF